MKKLTLFLVIVLTTQIFPQNFWEETNLTGWWWVQSLAINSEDHIFAGTKWNGILRTTNNGARWIVDTVHTIRDVRSLVINKNNNFIFAGTYGQGVYRSTDNGESWTQINNGFTTNSSEYICTMAISPNNDVFAATFYEVYRSTDNGDSWSLATNGITKNDLRAMSINSTGDIFVASSQYTGKIFRSTNNGQYWINKSEGLTSNFIYALAVNSEDHIFAGTDKGIFQSTDNGENWVQKSNGINLFHTISSLTINSNGNIFAGTFAWGIYRSTNNANNWELINEGFNYKETYISSLAINSNGFIYAGIDAKGGVYRSINSTTSVKDKILSQSQDFSLSQNYPNPFNPLTSIQYAIRNRQFVMIKVYDLLGKEVMTLIDEEKLPGNYEVEFDGSNLTSGTYFYRMQAGDFSETKKLILVK